MRQSVIIPGCCLKSEKSAAQRKGLMMIVDKSTLLAVNCDLWFASLSD